MRRPALHSLPALIGAALFISAAYAQVEVVAPTGYYPARVVYVVDVSASIADDAMAAAVCYVQNDIEALPFDGAAYTAVAFAAGAGRYPVWIDHPDPAGNDDLLAWLSLRPVITTATAVELGLRLATEVAGVEHPTTFVLVTDGNFGTPHWTNRNPRLLVDWTRWSSVDGRAVKMSSWLVIGVGVIEGTTEDRHLARIATEAGGGYYRIGE